jgi:hypothetical protein
MVIAETPTGMDWAQEIMQRAHGQLIARLRLALPDIDDRELAFRVFYHEAGSARPLFGLLAGQSDRSRRAVDACRNQAAFGSQDRMLARTATDVEHPAPEGTSIPQRRQRPLGATDVPRRCGGIKSVELLAVARLQGTRRIRHFDNTTVFLVLP